MEDKQSYRVQFGTDQPSCECYDWERQRLPCKHFFAVFRHFSSWSFDNLLGPYKDSPFFTLDEELFMPEYASARENNLPKVNQQLAHNSQHRHQRQHQHLAHKYQHQNLANNLYQQVVHKHQPVTNASSYVYSPAMASATSKTPASPSTSLGTSSHTNSICDGTLPIIVLDDNDSQDATTCLTINSFSSDDPKLTLYMESKFGILKPTYWLHDSEIHAGQVLLKKEFPFIDGLQDPAVKGSLVIPATS